MSKIVVFIGSFDPIHAGHIECAQHALKKENVKKVVFLPNNQRRGKPNRASLALRARWISFSMPVYNHSGWISSDDNILCDTRECDYVVDILRDRSFGIVGLVGSDLCKPPKLIANEWIIVERDKYPIENALKFIDNKSVTIISRQDTKWQHLSSSLIKESAKFFKSNKAEFPRGIIHDDLMPYYEKQFLGETLSHTTIAHSRSFINEQDTFKITYLFPNDAKLCLTNLAGLQHSSAVQYFTLPRVLHSQENVIYFSILDGITVFNFVVSFINEQISEKQLETVLIHTFKLLQKMFFSKSTLFPHVFHCDPSSKNIIYNAEKFEFGLVDFENCKFLTDCTLTKQFYDRFLSSFEFYLKLEGFERDEHLLKLIENCEKKAFIESAPYLLIPKE